MPSKHVPMRKCIACNQMKEKKDLIRFIKNKDIINNNHSVIVDKSFKQDGRGAYLCKNLDCLKKAQKTKRFNRVFSCPVNDDFYKDIENLIISDI